MTEPLNLYVVTVSGISAAKPRMLKVRTRAIVKLFLDRLRCNLFSLNQSECRFMIEGGFHSKVRASPLGIVSAVPTHVRCAKRSRRVHDSCCNQAWVLKNSYL